jgi:hypothetical protein
MRRFHASLRRINRSPTLGLEIVFRYLKRSIYASLSQTGGWQTLVSPTWRPLLAKDARVVITLRPNAVEKPYAQPLCNRDDHIAFTQVDGRLKWQTSTGYGQQTRIDTAMGRHRGALDRVCVPVHFSFNRRKPLTRSPCQLNGCLWTLEIRSFPSLGGNTKLNCLSKTLR